MERKSDTISTIYTKYKKLMFFAAHKYLKEPHLVEEAVQETIIKIIRNLDSFLSMSEEKQKNYVLKTAKFTAISIFNQEAARGWQQVSVDEMDDISYVEDRQPELPDQLVGPNVSDYIKSLSDTDKDIIIFVYGYDMSYKEIAELLKINEAAVRKRLSRAIDHLRKKICSSDSTNTTRSVDHEN